MGSDLLSAKGWCAIIVLVLTSLAERFAIVAPDIAVLVSNDGRCVPADLALVPAFLGGCPAALVVSCDCADGLCAPVGALEDAVVGDLPGVLGLADIIARARLGVVDLGAGDLVGGGRGSVVQVESEARVLCVDVARDADRVLVGNAQVAGGTILDEDLGAAVVELRVALGSRVQGDEFGADEVVAGGQSRGKLHGEEAVVVIQGLGAPLLGVGVVTIFPDLEPTGSGGRIGEDVVDLLDIDRTGTLVAAVDGTGP